MSNHPQIPPNLPMIRKPSEFCPGRFHWTIGKCRYIFFEEDLADRPIIAAAARCAWIDEAEKKNGSRPLPMGINADAMICLNHAEAWRVWGKE